MHQAMAAALDEIIDGAPAIQDAAREGGVDRAAALADDRPAHAEGLDRARGGRRPAGRGHLPRAPGPAGPARREPGARARSSRRGCAPTARRSSSTSDGRPRPERRSPACPRASAAWAPTRTPTAACCCATSGCPTSATTRSTCPRPATTSSEATRVLGGWLREVARGNPETLPRLRARRDRLEPARRRHRGERPRLDGRDGCPPTTTCPPTAASWRCSPSTCARAGSRATC